jgi:UDP-GlcNAc:undecaprenyl-phosphate GlcNAc-1-phosphate transferase
MNSAILLLAFTGALIACLAVVLLISLLIPLARRIGLVDKPRGRKQHSGDVPLVGGLAIFIGYVVALVAMGQEDLWRVPEFWVWLGLLLLSLWDDIRPIMVGVRVAAQVALILLLSHATGLRLEQLGYLMGDQLVVLGWLALPVTLLGLIGIKNGINLIDGLDGLAGTQVLSVLFWFSVLGMMNGLSFMLLLCAPLAGAVLGFLAHNLRFPGRPARVFLGDNGSVFLGFAVGWFAVIGSQRPIPAFAPIEAVWVLGLPVLDTIRVMISRMARRQSPFAPGRDHLHHLLLDCGWSVNAVVLAMFTAALAMGGVAWIGRLAGFSEALLFALFLLLSLAYLLGVQTLERRLHPAGQGA